MKTPEHWRNVRIDEIAPGKFSVRTFYCHGRFGPLALLALGQAKDTATEDIGLTAALAIGAKLEAALAAGNSDRKTRRGR
jgi:hypothetical protein